jgi:hypothetical protein
MYKVIAESKNFIIRVRLIRNILQKKRAVFEKIAKFIEKFKGIGVEI